jgi:hypothetical protein
MSRTASADQWDVVDAIIDQWADAFLHMLSGYTITSQDVDSALSGEVSAEDVNVLFDPSGKTAGIMDTVHALGGKVLSGAWHMITEPFHVAWKLFTSAQYRAKVVVSIKRAIRHEWRASKHLLIVANRLLAGEEVKPQEVHTAAIQFVDVLTKVLLVYFIGPHLVHLFSHGILKAVGALLSPLDEIAAVLVDKPLRMVTQKFLGRSVGLLPSGFYTHI